ncbi:copper-transporting P-type ATPase [Delitschia confertaspora ATCC 74209]|uniref:Copper-transporting P-type ATPase n=1 Tax=Delitschia confertaspora ATCC 74209 TaxID=1513339 RepID=A0A9P4JD62_9PLEO|nr:copper-transporting P-type ATPase [Delitschia confertaspora ATCC 74209]
MEKRQRHAEHCDQCRAEAGGVRSTSSEHLHLPLKPQPAFTLTEKATTPPADSFIRIDSLSTPTWCKATLSISGMTCSSCVSSITHAVEQLPWVRSIDVNLLTASGSVIFDGKHRIEEIVEAIEDVGFDATVEIVEELGLSNSNQSPEPKSNKWRATFAIEGMTCSSCVGNLTNALKPYSWIEKADVNLVSNSATIVFLGKGHETEIKEIIEDAGYEATLEDLTSDDSARNEVFERSVAVRIDGMFCPHCPGKIIAALQDLYGAKFIFEIEDPLPTEKKPILHIRYIPDPTNFTIRHILAAIQGLNPTFKPSIYHPPTIEDRAREMHARERRRVLFRLGLSFIVAIPTFVLGIVYMSLVGSSNPVRKYLMQPMWSGNVTRLGWALFILATPVYFFAADTFHARALKEIRAMWRPGSRTPILQRFYRFGSMNMLLSLGTTIAYVASVVELALSATKLSGGSMTDSYFDSVVFLTMFILIGRFLEAYSKTRAGDAVTSLGKLRPDTAILVEPATGDQKVPTDLLEMGDIVRVPHGASPPFDGTIVEGTTDLDESSLTGESRAVHKTIGDTVYSGTINKGMPVKVRLTTISGTSMLDHIINVVREGQTRRAPVERVADIITSHFVPFVTAVAIITWLVWLILGMSGTLPRSWRGDGSGGWALWSLRFAIAVFVVACPCGIGLAAPTALFVGGGLAAKYGILVKGGGEAFQEASSLDCIVFDKTGTLTQGGDPAVTDHLVHPGQEEELVFSIVKDLESNSSHPVAHALASFCTTKPTMPLSITNVTEIPGKGLQGTLSLDSQIVTAVIGNEAFLSEHHVDIPNSVYALLSSWQSQGKSVALVALSRPPTATTPSASQSALWEFAAAFAISDPVRPDAASTIAALRKRGIDVWMLSGDNERTAQAVGAQVGILSTNVIAGVMPDQKAEKIRYLQRSLTKRSTNKRSRNSRATIAMVGDGINDAPALSTADLSIALSSGSDIALSSSSFILLSTKLSTLLTLLDLSRAVFRRIWFNFGWALVYNIIAMPIAAGVLYPITTGGGKDGSMGHDGMSTAKHVKLDPVWASLAMALSSVSVVCSSLALRSRVAGIGFRVKRLEGDQ